MNHDTMLDTAVAAVRKAMEVCQRVQQRLVRPETLAKKDKSPVTVADFASQAVVCAALEALGVPVVGEEDSRELRAAEQSPTRRIVVEQVAATLGAVSESQVLGWIDLGGAAGDSARYWTLDPIDGTKGFLRQEQYAVALALIEEGQVVLGVLGCPNLDGGVVLSAAIGKGCSVSQAGLSRTASVSSVLDAAHARFCESVESGHSDQDRSARLIAALGTSAAPVRMDSQCKYAVVAQGGAEVYLRLPTSAEYRENIWDHAAGMLCVTEAGGRVSDITGQPLDFSRGRRLENNRGVVASNGQLHDAVLAALRRAGV